MLNSRWQWAGALVGAACLQAASAAPVPIQSDSAHSTEGIGSFTGTLSYTPGTAILEILLTNTTASGFITGVAFNINSMDATAFATYLPAMGDAFVNLVGPVAASPFGSFDAAASLPGGGGFNGSGSPNSGVGSGVSKLFRFQITASDAGSLDELDFISSQNATNQADLLVRIRGITTGAGSDKVPGLVVVIPAPMGVSLGLAGLAGVASLRRRR